MKTFITNLEFYTARLVFSTAALAVLHTIVSFVLNRAFSLTDFFLTTVTFGWHDSVLNTVLSTAYLLTYYTLFASMTVLIVVSLTLWLTKLVTK